MQLGRLVTLMSPERRCAPLSSLTSLHKTPKLHEPLGLRANACRRDLGYKAVTFKACKAEGKQASKHLRARREGFGYLL